MAARMEQANGPTRAWSTMGGEGDGSYSRESTKWSRMGSILVPSLQHAVRHRFSPSGTGPVHYADFGCALGANPIGYAKLVVDALRTKPELRDREIVCHFCDLPSNDFNTLFRQLPPLVGAGDGSAEERTWFADAVPGTHYGRLFPRSSLHVAISTLTLHYLCEIPKAIMDKSSPAFNRGKIGCYGASAGAAEAYADASREALRRFFECRAEEMASGGVFGFFCLGRRERARPEEQLCEGSNYFVLDIQKAWKDLIHEGVIGEESLDTFNLPLCHPSIEELQEAIEHPPSAFHIEKLDYVDKHPLLDKAPDFDDAEAYGKSMGIMFKHMASMLASHRFAPEFVNRLEERFCQNCKNDFAIKKKTTGFGMFMGMCVGVVIRK